MISIDRGKEEIEKMTVKLLAVLIVGIFLGSSLLIPRVVNADPGREGLQNWFTANGYDIDVWNDELPGIEMFPSGYCEVTILNGEHGYDNPTGYYIIDGETMIEILLFPGRPNIGATASFSSGVSFGFYIESNDGTFFTETQRNGDNFDHALVFYNTKGLGYIVAFEDLLNGGDKDYQDRIIEVVIGNVPPGENVTVNPDPDVILTFDHVITGGDATVEKSESPPEGVPPLPGIITLYFDIEVTAIFEDNVLVGIKYDDTGMSLCQEKRVRLCVYTGEDPVGDVNHDGIVDLKDIFLVTSALGTKPGDPRWKLVCDLNGDGRVNLKDLSIALQHFGQSSWKDITQYVDIENNIVYGETGEFSIFGGHR
jgi:hypothetical protein